ncbi:MAG TPA: hypothetical protein VGL59_26785 [Polyangia bacterium]
MKTKRKSGRLSPPAPRRAVDGKTPDREAALLEIVARATKATHLVASSLGALNVHLYLADQKTGSADGRRHIRDASRVVRSSGEQLERVSQLLSEGKAAALKLAARRIHEEKKEK